jgi:hypothetical protein
MRKLFTIIFLNILCGIAVNGQYFSTGEDPARLNWRQISTLNFQLIYPDDFEEQAQKLANYFEKVYKNGSNTLNHNPRKISIIFHNQTVKSNGLVGWAPRRMEIFTPPHQAIYGQDWLEQLAIHEFRHVVQIDKIHSQLPGIIKIILGEQGSALVTGAYLPFWFLEGDAVVTETALSNFGRGRLPSFLMEHRAQVVEKGVLSFDKAFNRSYRDFVPDHYKLGYHLVGETRVRYGAQLWENAINRIAKKPLSITPLNRSLKIQTGMNQQQLYHSVFDSLFKVWKKEDLETLPTISKTLKAATKAYTSYRYNHILPAQDIITLKTGFDKIPQFIRIDKNGRETILFTPGQIFDESVGYRENLVAWSEFVPDMRWTHSGRSILKIFNTEDYSLKTLFPEFKCFAPAISPDKQYVAVVEVNSENNYYLSAYSTSSGALIKRYQLPDNNYIFSPAWKNDSELAIIVLTRKGKEIALVNPFEETIEWLLNAEMGEIKQLLFNNGDLYFISGFSGKDELWRMTFPDQSLHQISKARFGHAFPAFTEDGRTILSDYTANGYQLISIEKSSFEMVAKDQVQEANFLLADALSGQEQGIINFDEADTLRYNSTNYHKALNLFKVHSWAPLVIDVNSYDIQPGVSINSQNLLGTTESTLGYKWNLSENTGKYFVNFEYRGWYPILKFEAETGKRRSDYTEIQVFKNQTGQVIRQDTIVKEFTWSEKRLSLNSRVPFNLTRGAWFRLLQPELKYDLTLFEHNTSTPAGFINGDMQTLAYRLYYHQVLRQAYRDLLPDWGIVSDISYRHSPVGSVNVGNIVSGQLRAYVPGLWANHGVSLYAGIQKRERGEKYGFGDVVRMPRGWNSTNNNQLTSISAEYRLPLFYPDINFGRWVYFRRVKAAIFGDYAWLSGNIYKNGNIEGTFSREVSSVGIDLTSDINVLRLYAPANAGLRTTYIPERNKFNFEFLFSIDFTSF